MKIVEVKKQIFKEVKVLKCLRYKDNRGYFSETLRLSEIQKVIPNFNVFQANESSSKRGVIRGMHFQWDPYMGKLVRTVKGHMVDLFLDIRVGSPNYGKIAAYEMPSKLTDEYFEWIFVPIGFAHGNFYLENSTIEYLCTGEYNPISEAGINPLSSDIDWSLCDKDIKNKLDEITKSGIIISDKDKKGYTIKDWGNDNRAKNFLYKKL